MYMSQHYKVALLGAGGVGKSYLTLQFTHGKFDEDAYDPTIEDQYTKNFEVDGRAIKLEILDTAGQEGFQHLLAVYLQEREAFILVFDITESSSFTIVSNLVQNILSYKGNETPIVVVGNKTDLAKNRQVEKHQGQTLIHEFRFAEYIEASAKLNLNVDLIFSTLVKNIWERNLANKLEIGHSEIIAEEVKIIVRKPEKEKNKEKCCVIF